MIVMMNKAYVVVQGKDAAQALSALGELGIVHIEHARLPEGADISRLKQEIGRLEIAVSHLSGFAHEREKRMSAWEEKLDTVIRCLEEIDQLKDNREHRAMLIQKWEPWGDFDPQDLLAFRGQGLCAHLYEIPAKVASGVLPGLPPDIICEPIFTKEGLTRSLVICKEAKDLPFTEVPLPEMSVGAMKALQEKDFRRMVQIEEELKKDHVYARHFEEILKEKRSQLKFQEALAGMAPEDDLAYLKGFFPAENTAKLEELAQKQSWGLIIETPDDDDAVPTLLRNPKWVEMLEPVLKFLDILPGYRELDVNIPFLLFFSLFFGILVGDAGYGLLMFFIAVFLHIRQKGLRDKKVIFLMYMLSTCAIVWGLLTGVVFGQGWTSAIKPLVPWLNDPNNMQLFCFIVGATHLTLAHVWRFMVKAPALTALAEVGWIMVLWSMFFLAKNFILDVPLPFFFWTLLWTGVVLAICFHQPSKNILKTVGLGLVNMLLSIANMFGDVMSYLRLFAVGLASVAVANFFNEIVAGIGVKTVFSTIVVVLLLVVGHGLNLILALLAVLVHGIRLNILEFSNHIGIEWSGVEYAPFHQVKNHKT